MEKGAFSILFIVVVMLVLPRVTSGEPRAEVLVNICTNQPQQNSTYSVSNYVNATENVRQDLETQNYGVEISGRGPSANYVLAQCYGDLSLVDCQLCYSMARTESSHCYLSNGGRTFLDGCFLRIANYSFFDEYTGPEDRVICGNITRKNSTFQETARQAVLQAALFALNNSGYARAEKPVSRTRNELAYVLANCWRTLSYNSCRSCLENASNSILQCLPWSEGRALNTGCFMRYSDTNFLNPILSNGSSRGTPRVVITVVVCTTIVVAGAAIFGTYIWNHKRKENKRKGSYNVKELAKILRDSSLNFKYSMLEKATGGFDEANKLGQGGFGSVYKGTLPDGREIAVKRLFFNNIHRVAEFYNEVNIISSLDHKNLVRLLGCSCSGPESLLVYEFLPNKSLDGFIFNSNKGKTLNWEKRFAIIIGIAEGLIYLHENTKIRIIHRDVKASNILLDTRYRAKIADFGLARSFEGDESHISTAVAGTLGYMAPEYLAHGQLTEKADVYSFGVLLLEIVAGRQNNGSKTSEEDSDSLVTNAWNLFQQGTAEKLIDPNLVLQNYHDISIENEVLRVVHVGLLCTQEIPSLRPSMSEALQMLAKKDEDLRTPTNPPFLDDQTMELNDTFESSRDRLISDNFDSVATDSQSTFYPR